MSAPMHDITNLPPQDLMMGSLERLARDPQIPTERITELFRLMERREKEVLRRAFFTDMNALQGRLTQIQRDKPNPAFNSRYATLEALDKAARPHWVEYGFAITFGTAPATRPDYVMVVCTVSHRSGYSEQYSLEGPTGTEGSQGKRAGATPIQGVGSAVKYLQRYLLQLVLNLVTANDPEDNDGNPIKDTNAPPDYADIVAQFETAAARIADNDQARQLLEWKPGVIAITALPNGAERNRYMQMRAAVQSKWLQPMDKPQTATTTTGEEIEGL